MSNGKGSRQRPASVSRDVYEKNWEAVFGKGKKKQKPKKRFSFDFKDAVDEWEAAGKKVVRIEPTAPLWALAEEALKDHRQGKTERIKRKPKKK